MITVNLIEIDACYGYSVSVKYDNFKATLAIEPTLTFGSIAIISEKAQHAGFLLISQYLGNQISVIRELSLSQSSKSDLIDQINSIINSSYINGLSILGNITWEMNVLNLADATSDAIFLINKGFNVISK